MFNQVNLIVYKQAFDIFLKNDCVFWGILSLRLQEKTCLFLIVNNIDKFICKKHIGWMENVTPVSGKGCRRHPGI